MPDFVEVRGLVIRLTNERLVHLEADHPEMLGQVERINEVLLNPKCIVRSRSDSSVELYYKLYENTPVTKKFMCVVAKIVNDDGFIITEYFTDSIKKGIVLWPVK